MSSHTRGAEIEIPVVDPVDLYEDHPFVGMTLADLLPGERIGEVGNCGELGIAHEASLRIGAAMSSF